jgi:hypothetical protein
MKLSKRLVYIIFSASIAMMVSVLAQAGETTLINGSVYCDHNKNGNCDKDDQGLKDIPVEVFQGWCGGNAIQVTHTDSGGKFQFKDLAADTYFVRADVPCVCGGRMPTTATCQEVVLLEGEVVQLPPFGYSEFGQ